MKKSHAKNKGVKAFDLYYTYTIIKYIIQNPLQSQRGSYYSAKK